MFENADMPAEFIPSDGRFTAGPSKVQTRHLECLATTGSTLLGTSHRKPAIKNLIKEIKEGLTSYFDLQDEMEIVLGNGGATCLFDMIPLGLANKKVAHFICGEFSDKWSKSSKLIPDLEVEERRVDFGQGVDIEGVNECDLLCMTLNETSTGVQLTKDLPSSVGDSLIAVDATSGAGQIPWDINKTDVFFFSLQKVFASEGGLWVAFMSKRAIDLAIYNIDNKKRYIPEFMNLKIAIENSRKNQTYTTPAVSTLFLFNEQLKDLKKVGYKGVIAQAEEKAQFLYSWAQEKDYLTCFIKEDKYRSRSIATIDVSDEIVVDDLIKKFEKSAVVHGINAYRKLGRNQFRIALFHNITFDDLQKLTKLISHCIEKQA